MTDIMIANSLKEAPGPCRLVKAYRDGRYYILPLGHAIPDCVEVVSPKLFDTPEDAADAACDDEERMRRF